MSVVRDGYPADRSLPASTLPPAGAVAGEDGHLLDEDEVWDIADAIPDNSAAAIALIEHRWAIPLRAAIARAGGFALSDAWIHPLDLVETGLMAAEELGGSDV